MTIKDLIHELSYFPPDYEVSVFGYVNGEEYEFEIDGVEGGRIGDRIYLGEVDYERLYNSFYKSVYRFYLHRIAIYGTSNIQKRSEAEKTT